MPKQTKFLTSLITAIIIVIGIWLFTLKLNLQNGFNNGDGGSGLNFSNLKNEISNIINKSPLTKPKTQLTNNKEYKLKDLTDKLAEEIKNQELEEQTQDWLTYTNKEYGFKFKYPKDWIIENNLESFIPPFKVEKQELSFAYGLFDNNEQLSIKDWVNKNDFFKLKQYENPNTYAAYGVDEPITKTLDGTEIKIYFGNASGGGTFGIALVSLNEKVLDIAYSLPPSANPDKDEIKNIFQQALSTFKFLE